MIAQIGCLGKTSPRLAITASLLYTLGVSIGAALVGLALSLLGLAGRWLIGLHPSLGAPAILLPVAVLALLGGLRDLGLWDVPLPQRCKQLPRYWMTVFGPLKTSLLWGFGVGTAYYTLIQNALYYVLALWIFLRGDPLFGMVVLAVYGLSHGVLLIVENTAVAMGADPVQGLLGQTRARAFYRLSGVALVGSAVYLMLLSNYITFKP